MRGFRRNRRTEGAAEEPKYRNVKMEYEGMAFDSKRELKRYLFLRDAERRGEISMLERQKEYELIPAVTREVEQKLKTKVKIKKVTEQKATKYRADFVYVKDGEVVVEDVKIAPHMIPADYRLKEKLMFYLYRIRIRRVYKPEEDI